MVVRKGYSMKKCNAQASTSSAEDIVIVDTTTQTDLEDPKSKDAATHTDVLQPLTVDSVVQTEIPLEQTTVQAYPLTNDTGDDSGAIEGQFVLCEGNNDEKFYPLVLSIKDV